MPPETHLLLDRLLLSSAGDSEGLQMHHYSDYKNSSSSYPYLLHKLKAFSSLSSAWPVQLLTREEFATKMSRIFSFAEKGHLEGLSPAVGEGVIFSPPEEGLLDLRLMLLGFCLGGGIV